MNNQGIYLEVYNLTRTTKPLASDPKTPEKLEILLAISVKDPGSGSEEII